MRCYNEGLSLREGSTRPLARIGYIVGEIRLNFLPKQQAGRRIDNTLTPVRIAMATSKIKMVGALSALAVASVMGQSASCVRLNATSLSPCPCDDATLTFTLEGETSVQANTVSEWVWAQTSPGLAQSEQLRTGYPVDVRVAVDWTISTTLPVILYYSVRTPIKWNFQFS